MFVRGPWKWSSFCWWEEDGVGRGDIEERRMALGVWVYGGEERRMGLGSSSKLELKFLS
jgi:hypothetical protein